MPNNSFKGKTSLSGTDIYYEYFPREGAQETIVLIHGFLSSLFSFRYLTPLLQRDYNVLSIDLPPFGKSGKSSSYHYSYRNMASTVSLLLRQLGISSCTVAGHSMGGQIALNLALQSPETVNHLVLLCSSGYRKPSRKALAMASRIPLFPFVVKHYLARSGLERTLRNVVFDSSRISDEMREGYLSPFLEKSIFTGLTKMIRDDEGDLPAELLHQVKVPCLLIWGEKDKVVPLPIGRRLAKELPNARLVILKETGHLVPEERPEEVFQQINDFLSGNHS